MTRAPQKPRSWTLIGIGMLVFSACVTPARGSAQPPLDSIAHIGMSANSLIQAVGEPARIDPTISGYDWWVYNQDLTRFFMVAVRDERVVKIYSNAPGWRYKEAQVGMPVQAVSARMRLQKEIVFPYRNGEFTIQPGSIAIRWSYLYYDSEAPTETIATVIYDLHDEDRITAIMVSEVEAYLASGNYQWQLTWNGDRPEFGPQELSPAAQAAVDAATARQFLDLTNAIRVRNGLHPLYWYSALADVATSHAIDMYHNDFFEHTSPTTGTISDRARSAQIAFSHIRENISFGRTDAIMTHESLMNSPGHRTTILHEDVTEFGAGAYQSNMYAHKYIRRRPDQPPRQLLGPTNTLSSITVEVERALFALGLREITENAQLITMDTQLAEQLGLSPGNRIRLLNMRRDTLETFTVALLRDEGAPVIRMGVQGRRRLGEEDPFRGYIHLGGVSARELRSP